METSDAKTMRKLAESIAAKLFTSNERKYSHLSLDNAHELGWCEGAVADLIEESLSESAPQPCPLQTLAADMVLAGGVNGHSVRLDRLDCDEWGATRNAGRQHFQWWTVTDLVDGQVIEDYAINLAEVTILRQPHEFKVGDIVQDCQDCHGAAFMVIDINGAYLVDPDGILHNGSRCRHAPVPHQPEAKHEIPRVRDLFRAGEAGRALAPPMRLRDRISYLEERVARLESRD